MRRSARCCRTHHDLVQRRTLRVSTSYTGTVMVTMVPTDAGSGLASTHYTLDGTDPTLSSPTYTGQFPLTNSATVKFRSWDNAGNVEATHTQSIQLTQSSRLGRPDHDHRLQRFPLRALIHGTGHGHAERGRQRRRLGR